MLCYYSKQYCYSSVVKKTPGSPGHSVSVKWIHQEKYAQFYSVVRLYHKVNTLDKALIPEGSWYHFLMLLLPCWSYQWVQSKWPFRTVRLEFIHLSKYHIFFKFWKNLVFQKTINILLSFLLLWRQTNIFETGVLNITKIIIVFKWQKKIKKVQISKF